MAWDIHDGLSWTQTPHALVGPFPPHPVTAPSFRAGAAEHFVGNGWADASPDNMSTDAVDNCLGIFGLLYNAGTVSADADLSLLSDLYGYGPFSSLFGIHPAIGPFDQLREYSSLFSDGILDAGDAPMPALRVDVKLGAGQHRLAREGEQGRHLHHRPDRPGRIPAQPVRPVLQGVHSGCRNRRQREPA